MPDTSTRPLLRGKAIKVDTLNVYKQLLTIQADPQTELHLGHIRVDVDDVTTFPFINVFLNGKPYLEDFPLLAASYVADFGRHVILNRVDKAILIEIKATAAGLGTLTATALVDGIEVLR